MVTSTKPLLILAALCSAMVLAGCTPSDYNAVKSQNVELHTQVTRLQQQVASQQQQISNLQAQLARPQGPTK
jgi:outer membrane murein-binding lipoprotein Lpp